MKLQILEFDNMDLRDTASMLYPVLEKEPYEDYFTTEDVQAIVMVLLKKLQETHYVFLDTKNGRVTFRNRTGKSK